MVEHITLTQALSLREREFLLPEEER